MKDLYKDLILDVLQLQFDSFSFIVVVLVTF